MVREQSMSVAEPEIAGGREAAVCAEWPDSISGVVTGTLVGFATSSAKPLVTFPHSPLQAVAAATVVDLNGSHVGKDVVLQFGSGDPLRPIVMGVLRDCDGSSQALPVVELDADGDRMTVIAKDQLVLRCGKASITLTKAGKVLIQGTYVSSRSSGVMRIKGGSIQLN